MTDQERLAELLKQLEQAEREAAAWRDSKYGAHHAAMGDQLVASIKAEIAKIER